MDDENVVENAYCAWKWRQYHSCQYLHIYPLPTDLSPKIYLYGSSQVTVMDTLESSRSFCETKPCLKGL